MNREENSLIVKGIGILWLFRIRQLALEWKVFEEAEEITLDLGFAEYTC